MNYDPVFIMFIAVMATLFIILFFIKIYEKKDNELSMADIELYKNLNMVKFNTEEWNKSFVTASQAIKGLREAMSIPARIVNRTEDSNYANSRDKVEK